jgi:hypothetical protein
MGINLQDNDNYSVVGKIPLFTKQASRGLYATLDDPTIQKMEDSYMEVDLKEVTQGSDIFLSIKVGEAYYFIKKNSLMSLLSDLNKTTVVKRPLREKEL